MPAMDRPHSDGLSDAVGRLERGTPLADVLRDVESQIPAWLTELHDYREEEAEEKMASTMKTLTDFYKLTTEEAERVYAGMLAGIHVEFEKGTCRTCKGKKRVWKIKAVGCFGMDQDLESCEKCYGTGVDEQRIKVPKATLTP